MMPFPSGLPKYDELSQAAKDKLTEEGILNGCGPESWRGNGPQWLFKACCYQHDYNYAAGGTEADRRWADWGFYEAMIKDAKRLSWWLQPYARFRAWVFYRLVRWRGADSFNYETQPKDLAEMLYGC